MATHLHAMLPQRLSWPITLLPHLCGPNWVGRALGLECFPSSPPDGPFIPSPAIARSFPLRGQVNRPPEVACFLPLPVEANFPP